MCVCVFSTDEETCVFKCSVSRETECSRVGKQSFIVTLGCNSVLLQFASPAGKNASFFAQSNSDKHSVNFWHITDS